MNIRVFFNAACSPALNAVELVFSDLKFELRKSNRRNMIELLEKTIKFLKKVNAIYMLNKIGQTLKYLIKALNQEEF